MVVRGEIYYLNKYKESPNAKEKPRFCIILEVLDEGVTILFHKLTTSEYGFNFSDLKEGANQVNIYDDIYYFPAGKVIGEKGFSFPKDCCIYNGTTWAISKRNFKDFNKFNPTKKDDLDDTIFSELLYFLYKSRHTKQVNKDIIEKVLKKIVK